MDWLLTRRNDRSIFTVGAVVVFNGIAGIAAADATAVVVSACFIAICCEDSCVPDTAAAVTGLDTLRINVVSTALSFVTFFTTTEITMARQSGTERERKKRSKWK